MIENKWAVYRQSDAEILADGFLTKKEAFQWASKNLSHLSREYWYIDESETLSEPFMPEKD